jgi:hypothetical protein
MADEKISIFQCTRLGLGVARSRRMLLKKVDGMLGRDSRVVDPAPSHHSHHLWGLR